ncbi:gas vesicle protein GvpG, partial [Streptomyces sp. NPDC002346]
MIWVAEKLNDAAESELHDPGVFGAQLAVLNRELEDGDISTEKFECRHATGAYVPGAAFAPGTYAV